MTARDSACGLTPSNSFKYDAFDQFEAPFTFRTLCSLLRTSSPPAALRAALAVVAGAGSRGHGVAKRARDTARSRSNRMSFGRLWRERRQSCAVMSSSEWPAASHPSILRRTVAVASRRRRRGADTRHAAAMTVNGFSKHDARRVPGSAPRLPLDSIHRSTSLDRGRR